MHARLASLRAADAMLLPYSRICRRSRSRRLNTIGRLVLHPVAGARHHVECGLRLKLPQTLRRQVQDRRRHIVLAPDACDARLHVRQAVGERARLRRCACRAPAIAERCNTEYGPPVRRSCAGRGSSGCRDSAGECRAWRPRTTASARTSAAPSDGAATACRRCQPAPDDRRWSPAIRARNPAISPPSEKPATENRFVPTISCNPDQRLSAMRAAVTGGSSVAGFARARQVRNHQREVRREVLDVAHPVHPASGAAVQQHERLAGAPDAPDECRPHRSTSCVARSRGRARRRSPRGRARMR